MACLHNVRKTHALQTVGAAAYMQHYEFQLRIAHESQELSQ